MESKKIKFNGGIKGFPLIKIKSREIIDKIRAGSFYMSSLRKYREMYAECGDDTIGDPNEGKVIIHDAMFVSEEMGLCEQVTDQPIATVNENDFVFCMFGVNPNKHDKFLFSEEQKQKLIGFDDTAMIVTDVYEFCRRIAKAAEKRNLKISSGFVNYYDETVDNVNLYINLITKGTENIVFHKTKKYEYQQEYRFTIPNNTGDDYLELDIGDISDITEVFSTEEMFSAIIERKANRIEEGL